MTETSSFVNGLTRAFKEVVVGIVLSIAVAAVARAIFGESPLATLIEFVMVLSAVAIFAKMRYWSNKYICGWLLGIALLWQAGLVTMLDFPLFAGPIVIMLFRIRRRVKNW